MPAKYLRVHVSKHWKDGRVHFTRFELIHHVLSMQSDFPHMPRHHA